MSELAPGVFHVSFLCHAHPVFDFGESLFDGVEVRGIGRQEPEPCASSIDGRAYGLGFMASQIVHDDNVSGLERPDELLFHIGQEACTVDRAVEDAGCGEPITSKRGNEGHGAPMAVRCEAAQTLALHPPAAQGDHVGLDPCLVDEHETPGIKPTLPRLPAPPSAGHRRPALFKSEQRFF